MSNSTLHHATEVQPLLRLLDTSLAFPPEYADQLTSHLPMALHALHSLGADPLRLQEFHGIYSQRFKGMVQTPAVEAVADWRSLRGSSDAYPSLLATFQAMVERDGADKVLRDTLPDLLPGVAAAAFHALIRTAHAVEVRHGAELAAALAYWAWRWQPLALQHDTEPSLPFDAWADRLVQTAQGWRTDGPLISIRMEESTHSEVYQRLAAGPAFDGELPELVARLARWAVARYVVTPNFTVLHMITGLRALRALLPWMGDCEDVQPILMRAVTAAYLAAKVLPSATAPLVQKTSWQEVIAQAVASNDDHVVKLVHACVQEAEAYGEGMYLQAARLAVR